MRIVFHLLDAGVGGAQRVAGEIAVELAGRGHELAVVVPADGPALEPFRGLGARVHLLDAGSLRRPAAVPRLARILDGQDLLYSHTSAPGQIVGGFAARRGGTRHLVHHHTYPYFSTRPGARFVQTRLYPRALRDARFIAVAEHVAEGLRTIGGIRPEQIVVIPNGVAALDAPERANEPARIGLLARIDPGKGVLTFVAAAAAARPPATFVVGGQASPFSAYVERVRAEAGRAGVELVVPVDDGVGFLAGLDVVAIPSEYEGSPRVLLEAMSLGKAIVASDIPGMGEVLGDAGVLVPPGDVEALARALSELGADPARRRELGARAREVARRDHDLRAWLAQVAAVVEAAD
jgi:glycosyltransferase involved in cell wall biosynthesis